ncbi:hypothetical protein C8T65DRAFT_630839 [Cerioporus squamosus]|nr:hypothetical protein C8T65DRAFT_630839 [Cerioporus squamosus]
MLSVRQFTATTLRQCSNHATASAAFAHRFRSISTGSSFSTPDWVDRNNMLETRSQWKNILDITAPTASPRSNQSPETIWNAWEKRVVAQLPRPHTAYSGRSVAVVKGDVQSALVKLKGILTINAVRSSHIRDERHEKKGEKRNRLKSQRWRRRFAHEVRKKVQLVNEIRARGA